MSKARLFHVDAFTSQALHGAAAPVIVVESNLETSQAAAIAAEFNQPVTVFLRPLEGSCEARFFEPDGEAGLVGHAGLAAGFIALEKLFPDRDSIVLVSPVGGEMPVERDRDGIVLDFSATPADSVARIPHLAETLGGVAITEQLLADFGAVAVLADEDAVHDLRPDLMQALKVGASTVIATAPGRKADFVSRVFAPKFDLPEDPVCGTAHRILVPYWAERLGKTKLSADQVSARGGQFHCELRGDRVRLGGSAVLLFESDFEIA